MSTLSYHLYLDDSGTRHPDHEIQPRNDGMDHFAMGGILIPAEAVGQTSEKLSEIKKKHGISVPLHSTKMRSCKGAWSWLGSVSDAGRAMAFMTDLNSFLEIMPAYAIGCVVHRPGYAARFAHYSVTERWRLCKSAYAIVVERAAKIASRDGRMLAVYVEQTGPKEDKQITSYHRSLIEEGMIFNPATSSKYQPIEHTSLQGTLLKSPKFFKKELLMGQIADVVLYPLIKGKYDENYRPYRQLKNAGRIVDDGLANGDESLGVKYYCFDK